MHLKSFLGLVEIQTKLASLIPFLLGTGYALYHFHQFDLKNFVLLFISMLAFDMVTTALNNYFDFKRASKKRGYNFERHNAIVRDSLKETSVVAVILLLLAVAILFGILLYFNTNLVVLRIGMASFGVGICYSFGPVPISRTPFGELFSGLFMGFVIVFLSIYIHIYHGNLVSIALENRFLSIRLELLEVIKILLFSVPMMFGIANIMLANNICDVEDDIENKRYTLPVFIGRKNALLLFKGLYYAVFADILALALLRVIPVASLLVLLAWIPVNKNVILFYQKQTKKDTFVLSVKNFMLIGASQLVVLFIALPVQWWIEA